MEPQSPTIPLPEPVWYGGEEVEPSLGLEAPALSLVVFCDLGAS